MLQHSINDTPLGTSFLRQSTLEGSFYIHVGFIKCQPQDAHHWARGLIIYFCLHEKREDERKRKEKMVPKMVFSQWIGGSL